MTVAPGVAPGTIRFVLDQGACLYLASSDVLLFEHPGVPVR